MAVRAERGPAALSPLRTVALAIGFVCALSASVLIFVADSAQYLRIGILVALWGFVFAALAAGRRQTEQAVAASSEVELRKSYEVELEREVTARREYELRLDVQLRREVQDDFTSQVSGLREELVRLRSELSEQWDSELRVERMVMHTQSVRMGGDRRGVLGHGSAGRALDVRPSDVLEHIDEGDIAEGDIDEGDIAEGDIAEGDIAEGHIAEGDRDEHGMSDHPSDLGPATVEVPVVRDAAPSLPSQPVAPPAAVSPPKTDGDEAAPNDVLARILAEAGSSPASRPRRHRYADEDEGAVPARS